MKSIRKKLRMLLAVCLLVPCISMVANAANGVLTFSDPTTKVGETVTVKVKLDANGSPIGDGDITVTYDTEKLEFVSGENAEGGDGTVKLSSTGDGAGSTLSYTMEFFALAEGETDIEVSDYTAYLYNDDTLNVTLGSSHITIEAGDPNALPPSAQANVPTGTGPQVDVNGVSYKISNDFADVLIPESFVRTAFTFEGVECQALKQEASGLYMVYLMDAQEQAKMFLYNPENGAFSACEKIRLSETSDVILMQFPPREELPKTYKETEFEVNGVVYPAWQNPEQPEFFIVNAVNTAGYKGYYQYDSNDGTYQRFVAQKAAEEEKPATGFFGKIEAKLKENLGKMLVGVWGIILAFIVVIIVLGVKLKHRNEELDDWYDDFGDEYEKKLKAEKNAKKAAKNAKNTKSTAAEKKSKKPVKAAPKKDERTFGYAELGAYENDDDNELYDDDFDEDLFADDDYDDDRYDDAYDDDDSYLDEFYDDDDDFDDKKDTKGYSIDFIDLD